MNLESYRLIQRFCKGYLVRKDIQAEKDAEATQDAVYHNETIKGISKRLGPFNQEDSKVKAYLEQGPMRIDRTKRMIRVYG